MNYWQAHPGVAVSIIEKLLNYSILTPLSVIHWALIGTSHAGGKRTGDVLAKWHIFELVFNTVAKVTGRVRDVARGNPDAETQSDEVKAMRELFRALEDALIGWSTGTNGEATDGDSQTYVRDWAERWLRVFRRKSAIEESFLQEAAKAAPVEAVDA